MTGWRSIWISDFRHFSSALIFDEPWRKVDERKADGRKVDDTTRFQGPHSNPMECWPACPEVTIAIAEAVSALPTHHTRLLSKADTTRKADAPTAPAPIMPASTENSPGF